WLFLFTPAICSCHLRSGLMEQRVRELERLLIHKEAELAKERDRCDKAKKKVRQLLAKLSERDQKIMALTLKLEAKSSKRVKDSPSKDAQQRAQIVARLEGLLEQMRQELTSSRLELDELLLRHQVRDEELKTAERSPEALHAQALLGMQVQDKKRSTEELLRKIQDLEDQLEDQRMVIVELLSGQPRKTVPEKGPQLPSKLRTFLEGAGPEAAELVCQNPELLEAFTELNGLSETVFDTLAPPQRGVVLSLVVAWAIVNETTLLLNDLSFEDRDLQVLVATLDACGLIKEWEMTRCRCGGEGFGELFRALARQPLCRLALGYNALGLQARICL
ncbi:ATP synthase subunit a, partial [Durusdinium trenchii]